MDDIDELQNGIFAFSGDSKYYSCTIVWFGDIDFNQRKGYYIDALCFDEGDGVIYEKRFFQDNLDMDNIEEVDKVYPIPEYELIKRLYEYKFDI